MINQIQKNKKQLKNFLYIPRLIYKNDPNWMSPKMGIDLSSFDARFNPALKGLKFELFTYESNKRLMGRVAAFLSEEFNRIHNTKAAFFGLFECVNDLEVTRELLAVVENFAYKQGMSKVIGPIDFTPNYTMGALIKGFERPSIMTPYNKPYYSQLIEECGYAKAMDLYSYVHERKKGIPARVQRLVPLIQRRYPSIKIRAFNCRFFESELVVLREVYNTAFKENWGFLPMSEAEIKNLGLYICKKGDPNLVYFAYDANNPVGILISLPDTNLKGRLRLTVLGVLPEYRGKGIETRLSLKLLENAFGKKRYQAIEYSVILEGNEPMNKFIKKESGCEVNKVFRVYEKDL